MYTHTKKVQYARIAILVLIILGILLPQLIGTTTEQAEKSENAISSLDDLNGKTVILLNSMPDSDRELVTENLPDSTVLTADSLDEMLQTVTSDGAFALVVSLEDRITAEQQEPELKIMPNVLKPSAFSSSDEWLYIMLKTENAGFSFTEKTLDDAGKKGTSIACLVGTSITDSIEKEFPEADIQYYNTNADMVTAVTAGMADYCVWYYRNVEVLQASYPEMAAVMEMIAEETDCFAMPKTEKGDRIREEFNAFVTELRADGEYSRIEKRWSSESEDPADYALDYTYSGENGTLKVVTSGDWNLYSFYANGELTGKFIELVCAFCAAYGYTPEFYTAEYSAELAGISTGIYDLMADVAADTPERAEQMNMSLPVHSTQYCLCTLGDAEETVTVSKASGFLSRLRASLIRTFAAEDRWQMILSGLGVTVAIALLTAVFGTILGALICAMRMSRSVFAEAFAQLYVRIIQGTPIVIVLMVLYYVILGRFGVDAFRVCVLGFTMDFAAYTSEMFRTGITAVPDGQVKAARALGFGRVRTFRKVILPQALLRIMPVYNGQLVSMVKMTSVAGYISVMDLTKVSDLIRSRTYEAFFPLITTALIYFLLSSLLVSLLRIPERKSNPALRSRKVKGVKEHD